MELFKTGIISLIVSILVNLVFYNPAPKIATVNISAITSRFISQESGKHHSSMEKQQSIQKFSRELESSLQKLASRQKLMLIPKEAVIKGGLDYTHELMQLMEAQS